ncbi:sulfite exporter TauE/SafE family protein [Curvibacter sp. RS43]|uniref:sulfite exporter TauE/SafE family protein n=1 Tax=Curvibacter microcysteis TaxID=3026419 RepID=UPI00235EF3C1|nr:sulfite exporter TauE/SafE family protein [Curvibacter sp. RS43]MDD0808884.1 sulfite exporter TauE/SafE family protein [Curvibacter sp. RS43]
MSTLAWTGLLMGLAGGPHCVAMCGAACAALGRASPKPAKSFIPIVSDTGAGPEARVDHLLKASQQVWPTGRELLFQLGRLVGYSLAGAAAAMAVDSLAWLSAQTAVLRPVWTLFHVLVLVWGGMLLLNAQQPLWVQGAARSVWQRVGPLATRQSGVFATGVLWTLLPCGLLYSALLVAGLSGSVVDGAGVMALFALGSSASLLLGPWAWRGLQRHVKAWRQDWGTRASGLLLCAMGAWALWMDMAQRVADWCR